MNTSRIVAVLAALGVLAGLTAAPPLFAGGFVVVVNHGNPAASLSKSDIKRIVTGGTKQWDNGAIVQLGIIADESGETQYLAELLDMSQRELLARIQEQVFKGELRRPVSLRSSADCVAFARARPGALCVASDAEPVPPEAHVVAIH